MLLDARRAVVIGNELRVEATLRELELTPEVLRIALEAGYATAALCTSNHPPNFGGMTMWAETVRSLREQLIPAGWTPRRRRQLLNSSKRGGSPGHRRR